MVKVLVVDDSAFVRRSLVTILERDPEIQVAGTAANGEEAIAKAAQIDPDVITMDVEMPKMNGLVALERIMAENPLPVIMVSSITGEGAATTLRAMELGALDYICKPGSDRVHEVQHMEKDICPKVKALARRKAFLRLKYKTGAMKASQSAGASLGRTGFSSSAATGSTPPASAHAPLHTRVAAESFEIVAIGVSTGGPPAVQTVLSGLPSNFPVPILIAQHMPSTFTGPFAERLNSQCAIAVKEAEPVERIKAGVVYICPGGRHLRLENRGGSLMAVVTEEPKEALYKPSANVLMETVGLALGHRALGVTMTGMGSDGVEGTRVLKQKGGWAIAQNEESCVVYGMPKAVVDAGLADEVVDLKHMSAAILAHFHGRV
ncbi:MAG: chemotaxis response regulator protein-glutamate methylesterase [Desulfovibrio sp.]|nr:chemotaxis response regulator protein-glutamate methylesterase [Desulfovibrio sp.]